MMREDSVGKLAAIVSKQEQHSEGSQGVQSTWAALGRPATQGGPGALHTAPKLLKHSEHGPSAAARIPVKEQAAMSVDDERRETMGGGCVAADEAAACADAKRMIDASLQAGTESTQASAQTCLVDETEQQVPETWAADTKSEEAVEGNRKVEADKITNTTQEKTEKPAAEAEQDLLNAQECDGKAPEAKLKCGDTCYGEEALAAVDAAHHSRVTQATTELPTTTSSAADLACPTFFENPHMWMEVASLLCLPSLLRLACTAARFRAVVCTCVRESAAQALDKVRFVPGHG